ncbi:MAG: ParB N-terminal domain-containing protein, partial [Clostridiales bacterium]
MKIEEIKLTEIKRYENNPRSNAAAVDGVAESIKEFGWQQPIVIDSDNIIIVGDTRFQAAERLGLKTAPCFRAYDLTADQIKAYRLADNKVGEIAKWDFGLLDVELQDISIDMSVFGFDVPDIGVGEIIEDDDFEIVPPEEPRAKLGDVYQLGNHRLMCGDSTSKDDIDILMDGCKADMVFTDPPWNVDYGSQENHPSWKRRSIMNDSMPASEFKKFMDSAFAAMTSVIKTGCMLYIVMSAQEWGSLMESLDDVGCHWSSTIIWAKDS